MNTKTIALGLAGTLLASCATTTASSPAPVAQPAPAAKKASVAELVQQRKYESAFKQLAEEDPGNANPDVVLQKIEIVTRYFAMSINYTLFAIKDLAPGEDLMALRNTISAADGLTTVSLDVPKVLSPLMEKNPADLRLTEALGNYYYERMVRFPGMQADPKQAAELLEKAAAGGSARAESLSRLGNCFLMLEDPDKALKAYEAALQKDPEDPSTSYNAAAIYLRKEELDKALALARKAYDGYGKPGHAQGEGAELVPRQRSEAIRMVGMAQAMKEDLAAARESFKQAVALFPDDGNARRFQYDVELKLGLKSEAVATATEAIVHEPHDLDAYGRMLGVFDHYKALPELRALLEALLPKYAEDAEVTGTLHFFAGETCFAQEAMAPARAHYDQARSAFTKAAPDHPALRIVDGAAARLPEEKAKPEPKAGGKKPQEPKAGAKKK
ncbi:MAG: tetratricopeptide repeat protein [Myxococcales bacterium]